MRQSTITFGVILFAFVVYITMRGQLPAYLDLFKSKPKEASSSGGDSKLSKAFKYFKKNAENAARVYMGLPPKS